MESVALRRKRLSTKPGGRRLTIAMREFRKPGASGKFRSAASQAHRLTIVAEPLVTG